MIKVGINYVSSMPILKVSKWIDVFKFPGIRCTQEELEQFLTELPSHTQADVHGLINFKPAWNSVNILPNAIYLNHKLIKQTKSDHFSTHIGQFPGDGDPISNFRQNLEVIRNQFPGIRLGGENVFSLVNSSDRKPHYMTLQSTSPAFINQMWEHLDFGVFDITHAKIAARDHQMCFEEYLNALNRKKVEIIHISGGMTIADFSTGNPTDVDLHTPCNLQDFLELKQILKIFPNTQMVISELAYSKGENNQRVLLAQEDYAREAQALSIAVNQSEGAIRSFFEEA